MAAASFRPNSNMMAPGHILPRPAQNQSTGMLASGYERNGSNWNREWSLPGYTYSDLPMPFEQRARHFRPHEWTRPPTYTDSNGLPLSYAPPAFGLRATPTGLENPPYQPRTFAPSMQYDPLEHSSDKASVVSVRGDSPPVNAATDHDEASQPMIRQDAYYGECLSASDSPLLRQSTRPGAGEPDFVLADREFQERARTRRLPPPPKDLVYPFALHAVPYPTITDLRSPMSTLPHQPHGHGFHLPRFAQLVKGAPEVDATPPDPTPDSAMSGVDQDVIDEDPYHGIASADVDRLMGILCQPWDDLPSNAATEGGPSTARPGRSSVAPGATDNRWRRGPLRSHGRESHTRHVGGKAAEGHRLVPTADPRILTKRKKRSLTRKDPAAETAAPDMLMSVDLTKEPDM